MGLSPYLQVDSAIIELNCRMSNCCCGQFLGMWKDLHAFGDQKCRSVSYKKIQETSRGKTEVFSPAILFKSAFVVFAILITKLGNRVQH